MGNFKGNPPHRISYSNEALNEAVGNGELLIFCTSAWSTLDLTMLVTSFTDWNEETKEIKSSVMCLLAEKDVSALFS